MKLDRNTNPDGKGKYALIKLRLANVFGRDSCGDGYVEVLQKAIDFGDAPDSDFFVIRLKDKYAGPALMAYAAEAIKDGELEYASEIMDLAKEAYFHPDKRRPD